MGAKNQRRRPTSAGRASRSRRFTAAVEGPALESRVLLSAVPTTTTLGASKLNPAAGQSVTLTATVADAGGPTPTGGTVTFLDGSTVLGTAGLTTARPLPTPALTAGTHQFSAAYGGTASFLGSSSLVSPTALTPVVAGNLFFGDGAAATGAILNNPQAVAFDSHGNLFITDSNHEVVREVTAANGTISTLTGKYDQGGYTGDGGAPSNACRSSSPRAWRSTRRATCSSPTRTTTSSARSRTASSRPSRPA